MTDLTIPDAALVPQDKADKALPLAITPQQARVDAVAALTTLAISKAATLQLTQDETARLTADFADADFRTGAAGKEQLLYLEHAALRDRLNSVLGLGQWAIIVRESWNEDFVSPKGSKGVRVYCRAMMLVRGCYVGEAVGDMDYFPGNAAQNYGDAFEGSKTAAFRRCAKEFGIGLQAWRKDWCEGWWQRKQQPRTVAPTPRAPQPPKPAATAKPAEPLTPEQRKAKLLATLGPLQPWACQVLIEEGILMPDEDLGDISLTFIERTSPDQMLALVKTVRMRKADQDQVPGAEIAAEPAPDEPQGVIGTVQEVNVKTGKTKAGKPWTKYDVKIDGVWCNTFSETLYKTAAVLKGEQCRYVANQTQFGHDLVSIEAVGGVTP